VAVAIGAGLYALAVVSSHVKPTAQAEPISASAPAEAATAAPKAQGEGFDLLNALDSAPSALISVDSAHLSNMLGQVGVSEPDLDASTMLKLSRLSGAASSR
jgi:hypothetical protein